MLTTKATGSLHLFSGAAQVPEKQSRRLDSWKEIATHLGRDVRTATRWEQEKALPVHRVPGGKRQAVFAYTEELDAWLNGGKAHEAGAGRRLWWVRAAGVAAVAVLALGGFFVYYLYRPGELVRVTFSGHVMVAYDARDRVAWEYEFPDRHLASRRAKPARSNC